MFQSPRIGHRTSSPHPIDRDDLCEASLPKVHHDAIPVAVADIPTAPKQEQVQNWIQTSNYGLDQQLNPDAATWVPTPDVNLPLATPIDAWIDALIPGQETVVPEKSMSNQGASDHLIAALVKLESDRGLPATQIPIFDGSPLLWPKFVEQFHTQVHSKPGINDARRRDLLQSHVSGVAQQMVRGIGYSGRCYADALQELKLAFAHRNLVARAYLDQITTGPIVPSRNPMAFRQFYVDVRDCILTLQQLTYTSDLQGTDLLLRVSKRLPADKLRFWNRHVAFKSRKKEPSLFDLRDWLIESVEIEFNPYTVKVEPGKRDKGHSKGALAVNTTIQVPKDKPVTQHEKPVISNEKPAVSRREKKQNTNKASSTQSSNRSGRSQTNSSTPKSQSPFPVSVCPLCNDNHHLYRCFKFVNRRPEERRKIVQDKKLCLNCLRSHDVSQCTPSLRCREDNCAQAHHTLLHLDSKSAMSASINIASNDKQVKSTRAHFQLVKVYACGNNGRWVPTVALMDSASEITVIRQSLARDLGLRGKTRQLKITTMNAESTTPSQVVSLKLRSAEGMDSPVIHINDAWTVESDAFQCPPQRILSKWEHVKELGLTNIETSEVQILIGINAHLQMDTRTGRKNQPIAVKTPLGWSLMGVTDAHHTDNVAARVNLLRRDGQQLQQQIEMFWSTESFGVSCRGEKPLSREDKQAEKIMEELTHLVNGQYEVGMLWRDYIDAVPLPDNRQIASRRYHLLEKCLRKDEELNQLYSETLNGYVSQGFARKLTPDEAVKSTPRTWYIPHQSVLNPNKPGKVRVVFDAAATCNGTSLNERLMTGPDLLNSLFGVLQRFRLYQVAICADVEGMFHRVRVSEADSDALRFLWKEDINQPGPPDTYKMLVHIFVATDSPTCANYALKRTANDNRNEFSKEAIDAVNGDFYVDDLAKSVDTVAEAVKLAKEIVALLKGGGFHLHKFLSNYVQFLMNIEKSERTIQDLDFATGESNIQRTLGLKWEVTEDKFIFKWKPKNKPITKRGVVSIVSSIFDPCGYLAPFVFCAKLLVQELSRFGLAWDEPLSEQSELKWKCWLEELEHLSSFELPRHHPNFSPRVECIQLHTFSDASESGFGAFAYLRYVSENHQVEYSLLAAKTRVASLKPVLSIPRLELQGALLASRLGTTLMKELHLPITASIYWTDSTTVLRPNRWSRMMETV
ncbi:uncharacterized protein LOC135497244 [Lineus longissimus]|uniref:uncharacterized protein LOC135497244 n=1 Tax=Lineus longissimus TaxID=88925 RepID=UPI00315D68E0